MPTPLQAAHDELRERVYHALKLPPLQQAQQAPAILEHFVRLEARVIERLEDLDRRVIELADRRSSVRA